MCAALGADSMARHVLLNALFQQGLHGLKFFQIWKTPQLAQTSGGCAVNAMKNGHGKTLAVQKHHQHGLQRAIGLGQHRLLAAQGKLGIKAVFLGNALVDFAARLHRIGEVLRQQVLAIGLLQQVGDKVLRHFGQLGGCLGRCGRADEVGIGSDFFPLLDALRLAIGDLLVQVFEQFPVVIF